MLCTAKVYNADECLHFGLADKIVSSATGEDEALAFVRQYTKFHYSITRSFKQVVKDCTEKSFGEALESERKEFCQKWGGQLQFEALEKRSKHIVAKI